MSEGWGGEGGEGGITSFCGPVSVLFGMCVVRVSNAECGCWRAWIVSVRMAEKLVVSRTHPCIYARTRTHTYAHIRAYTYLYSREAHSRAYVRMHSHP